MTGIYVIDHDLVEVTNFFTDTAPVYLPGGPGPLTHDLLQARERFALGEISLERFEEILDAKLEEATK